MLIYFKGMTIVKTLQLMQKKAATIAKKLTSRKLKIVDDKYITINSGEHYILHLDEDVRNFIITKHWQNLNISLANGVEILVKDYFTICQSDLSCLVSVEFTGTNNTKNFYYVTDNIDTLFLKNGDVLLYAYGNTNTLVNMMKVDITNNLISPIDDVANSDSIIMSVLAAVGLSGASNAIAVNVIKGSIVLGPVLAGNGLKVLAYKQGESLFFRKTDVSDDGKYSLDYGNYKGILILRLIDENNAYDYMDETSGAKDLENADLMVIIDTRASIDFANINLITAIAATIAGVSVDIKDNNKITYKESITTQKLTNTKDLIDYTFNINDIVTDQVKPVIDVTGALMADANHYGRLLAALSAASSLNRINEITTKLAQEITANNMLLYTTKQKLLADITKLAKDMQNPVKETIQQIISTIPTPVVTIDKVDSYNKIIKELKIINKADNEFILEYKVIKDGVVAYDWSDNYQLTTDGDYVLEIRNKSSNNQLSNVKSISFILDTTAPSTPTIDLADASDTGSNTTDNITSNTKPIITGTAEADATVKIYNGTTEVGSATADASGNYIITVTALNEGTHKLTAIATDTAGNTSTASSALNITIDTTAPSTPTIILATASDTGSNTTDNITSNTKPTITGTAEAGATVKIYNGAIEVGSATADATTGVYNATLTTLLNEGVNNLSAKATDTAGNTSAASSALDITVDTTAPTLEITTDTTIIPVNNSTTVTFTFSEEIANFALSDITADNGSITSLTKSTTDNKVWTATFTANATGSTANNISVDVGAYSDIAGNNNTITATSANYLVQTPLLSTWKTSADNETVTIRVNNDYEYNYTIDWGDGSVESSQTASATHVYATAGNHQIAITGDYPVISFGGALE